MSARNVRIINPVDGHAAFTSVRRGKKLVADGVAVRLSEFSIKLSDASRGRAMGAQPSGRPFSRLGSSWTEEFGTACGIKLSRCEAEYRKLESAAVGTHSEAEWQGILDRYGRTCLRCGVSAELVPLTKDHITPLASGGTNFAANIQPLCGPCNSWKGNREIDYRRVETRDKKQTAAA